MLKVYKVIYVVLFCVCVLCLSVVFLGHYTPVNHSLKSASFIVILGAGYHKDGQPVPALEKRLDKGVEVWVALDEVPQIIVSGNEREVDVMKEYLMKKGIHIQNIIQDTQGKSTFATLKNTWQYAEFGKKSLIFISQAYHLPRIKLYSKMLKIQNAQYIATDRRPIPLWEIYFWASREVVAIIASVGYIF